MLAQTLLRAFPHARPAARASFLEAKAKYDLLASTAAPGDTAITAPPLALDARKADSTTTVEKLFKTMPI